MPYSFPFIGEVAALSAALIWATSTTIYSRCGAKAPAVFLNLFKGSLATIMLATSVVLLADATPHLSVTEWLWLAGSGVIGISVGDSAYFASLKRIGPNRTLLVESMAPPLTGILALLFLSEALPVSAWLGIGLTMSGIFWVMTEHTPKAPLSMPGLGFACLAALSQATGVVMSRHVMTATGITPLWAALVRLAAASIALWLVLPIIKPGIIGNAESWRSIGKGKQGFTLFCLAVFLGTFLGIWLQQASLKLTNAAIAQTLLSVSPLFALIIARLSGQKVSRRSVIGSCVTVIGIALFFW